MKRIYLLMILFVALGSSAFAQTDMKLLHLNMANGDTVKWSTDGKYGRIIRWGFENLGPNALVQATDTIMLKRAYTTGTPPANTIRLTLPTGGVPVGDTVYYTDTVFFTSGPASNPYQWCDSIWTRRSGAVFADGTVGNNKNCFTLPFKQMPAVSVENIELGANGIAIYPNPASNTINVNYDFAANSEGTIVIKDLTGKTIYTQNLGANLSGQKSFEINVSSFATGIYILEMYANEEKAVSKFNVIK